MRRIREAAGLPLTALLLAGCGGGGSTPPPGNTAPAIFRVSVQDASTATTLQTSRGPTGIHLSPVVWVLHTQDAPLFTAGQPDRGQGLEQVAEDGVATRLAGYLASHPPGIADSGVGTGILLHGQSGDFTITASPGERLSFATMLGESDDWFFAPTEAGIPLFDAAGNPLSGDVTAQCRLWDCGTEIDEEPNVGPDTAPRQSGLDVGPPDPNPVVRIVPTPGVLSFPTNAHFALPDLTSLIRVTITPVG